MKKKLCILLTVLALSLSMFSCQEVKYGHCELILPLDADYRSAKDDGVDAVFTNGVYAVGILRISFAAGFNQGISETLSARELAELWKAKTDKDVTVHTDEKTPYYFYFKDGYFYTNGFYRSPYAYFVVLLSAPEELYPECFDGFIEILNGAIFEY